MRCPTLSELPPLPPHKAGWPWTEQSPQLPDAMPDGSPWPKVSIVTPSYNQAQFLEETIRSVLLQGYPNQEYIIIDGGSSDGSVDVIRKYEPWLTHWVSQPDSGPANAINKGWRRATGAVVGWLNSDDILLKGAIGHAVRALQADQRIGVTYSECRYVDAEGKVIGVYHTHPVSVLSQLYESAIPQPTCFIRHSVLERCGLLDEKLKFAFDYEYWFRVACEFDLRPREGIWATYRLWSGSKTVGGQDGAIPERIRVVEDVLERQCCVSLSEQAAAHVRFRVHLDAALASHRLGELAEADRQFDQAVRHLGPAKQWEEVVPVALWQPLERGLWLLRRSAEVAHEGGVFTGESLQVRRALADLYVENAYQALVEEEDSRLFRERVRRAVSLSTHVLRNVGMLKLYLRPQARAVQAD